MKLSKDWKEGFYRNILENLYDGVYFVDRERRISYWNAGAKRITGYPPERMLGSFCYDNLLQHITEEGLQLCQHGCPLLATIQDGKPREAQVFLRHAEGYRVPVLVRTSPILDKRSRIVGAVEVFSNNQTLMKMRRRVSQLEQTVVYDALTMIGNRKHIELKLKTALQEYQQNRMAFGILFIDIDHFKSFNDTYGHITGDKVLRAVANTLRYNLRETDTCGRWGGEEFLAIVFNVNAELLKGIAEKLRFLVAQTGIQAGDETPQVTISIGGTLICPDDTLESLIDRADKLMYISKSTGRNRVTIG
jgi:diguanylate cyclase (GGDEF)-like protein/PAS domain S-box-containing protein